MSDLSEPSLLPFAEPVVQESLFERSRRILLAPRKPSTGGLVYVALFLFFIWGQLRELKSLAGIVALILVLLFHEAGHALGMRLFGFSDIRMFFIPFFGAAVSGRARGVAAWKDAVVSLLGPVPGIALGMVGYIVYAFHPSAWLINAVQLLLILNVFNLLPFGALDGGRFLQRVLFSRHRVLDVGFQAFGSALLGWWAISSSLVALSIFVLLSLLALPSRYRVLSVAATLRPELKSAEPSSLDDRTLDAVYRASRDAMPAQGRDDPEKIGRTMDAVIEASKPAPGVFATLALLMVYTGALLVGLVLTVLAMDEHKHVSWRLIEEPTWQADFPQEPAKSAHLAATPTGEAPVTTYRAAVLGSDTFSVSISEAPSDVQDTQAWLDLARTALLKEHGWPTVLRSDPIPDHANSLELEAADKDTVLKARLFVVGPKLYEVVASAPTWKSTQQRFYDSFTLGH